LILILFGEAPWWRRSKKEGEVAVSRCCGSSPGLLLPLVPRLLLLALA
jgi:hypothetical protein